MRIVLIAMLVAICASIAHAEPLSPAIEAEREANIEAAKRRAAELQRVLDHLEQEIDEAEARGVPPGKRVGERSEGKIVNGVSTGAYPTAGALIMGTNPATAGSHCTGTLIGRRTFLTAAHCVVRDPDPAVYHVFLQHGGIFEVSSLVVHPDYDFPHADLAVLQLANAVDGITPTPLNTLGVPNGSPGEIVGYGRAGGLNFDYGIKRVGTVLTAPCDPHRPTSLLCWDFDDPVGAAGLDSNTCNADSGGPLYIQRVADGPLILAGVTSGGSQTDCLAGDHSYDVDVQQFVQWIRETSDEDLDNPGSGALPAWGSDQVQTLRAEVAFSTSLRSRIYTLDVPADVAVLRIAMNGHDEGNRNFDLYVGQGDTVSPTDRDCAQEGSGQYGFCEFADPATGPWSILLDAKSGHGTAQVSATLYGE